VDEYFGVTAKMCREFQNRSVTLMLQLSLHSGIVPSLTHHGMPITTTRQFQLWCWRVLLKLFFFLLLLFFLFFFSKEWSVLMAPTATWLQHNYSWEKPLITGTILLRTLPSPSY